MNGNFERGPRPINQENEPEKSSAGTHEPERALLLDKTVVDNQAVMSEYQDVLAEIIAASKDHSLRSEHNKTDQPVLSGEFQGKQFVAKLPTAKTPKHVQVLMIDITNQANSTFSCVLKGGGQARHEADHYRKYEQANPLIQKNVPQLYGTIEEWMVVKKLQGLEGEETQELDQRLAKDPEFLGKFTDNAYTLMHEVAEGRLQMNDVDIGNGHNCKVDPETAAIRLLELDNLHPHTYLRPNELLTKQLISELNHVKLNESHTHQIPYAMGLLKRALQDYSADDFYIQPRVVKPTHPDYKKAYDYHEFETNMFGEQKKLTPEIHQAILNNSELRELYTMLVSGSVRKTLVIPRALMDAVEAANQDSFTEILRQKMFAKTLTDGADPRAKEVILTDDTRSHTS